MDWPPPPCPPVIPIVGQVLAIAGADQAEYNGQFRVLTTTAFTYAVTGTPGVTRHDGDESLGQSRPARLGKALCGHPQGSVPQPEPPITQNLLLVDNAQKTPDYDPSWAKWANVGIVEDLSDIDTIVGAQAPHDPNRPLQNWAQVEPNQWGWYKWYHARQTGYEDHGDGGEGDRNWVLVGDDGLFYLFCTKHPGFGWYGRNSYCFGDLISFKPGTTSAQCCVPMKACRARVDTGAIPAMYNGYGLTMSLDFSGKVLLRSPPSWATGAVRRHLPEHQQRQQICGRGSMPFPNGADYSLWLLPPTCERRMVTCVG